MNLLIFSEISATEAIWPLEPGVTRAKCITDLKPFQTNRANEKIIVESSHGGISEHLHVVIDGLLGSKCVCQVSYFAKLS